MVYHSGASQIIRERNRLFQQLAAQEADSTDKSFFYYRGSLRRNQDKWRDTEMGSAIHRRIRMCYLVLLIHGSLPLEPTNEVVKVTFHILTTKYISLCKFLSLHHPPLCDPFFPTLAAKWKSGEIKGDLELGSRTPSGFSKVMTNTSGEFFRYRRTAVHLFRKL